VSPSPLVLVVDDEADVRTLMRRLVARVRPDATILSAADGQAALALCQQKAPALIVSDVSMRVMSGIDLVTALRAAGVQIPIILVSADPGYEQDALSAGADAFIFKPELARKLPPLLRGLL
jgi:two-component system response regulator AlgR